jgi:uncharacterized protein (DUF488 family)
MAAEQAAGQQLWTVGHSTHSADAFAQALKRCSVERVVDVRTVPRRASRLLARSACAPTRGSSCHQ